MMVCHNKDLALFLVRMMVGIIFTAHGLQKTFGLFGGMGLNGFVSWLATLGVPRIVGIIGAYSELIGGLMLLFGIAAEIGALLEIAVMVVAIALVHLSSGFFGPKGFEYPLSLLVSCAAIVLGGPGCFALFTLLKR